MMQEREMQEQPSGKVRGDGIQHRKERPAMAQSRDSPSTVEDSDRVRQVHCRLTH